MKKRYLLLKDWDSKTHGKTIRKGTYVIANEEVKNELEDLGCIKKAKKKKKKEEK